MGVLSKYGGIQPYIITCSEGGKLLHYNGAMKPWILGNPLFKHKPEPVCALPRSAPDIEWKWVRTARVWCDDIPFVRCSELWWAFISEKAACALKDFDKEWKAEDKEWAAAEAEERAAVEMSHIENEQKDSEK